MKIGRPEPLEFELGNGRSYIVGPATRGQIRACLALDPEDDEETTSQADARRSKQLRILATPGDASVWKRIVWRVCDLLGWHCELLPFGKLTAYEEQEILHAIVAQHHGIDPHDAVAILRVLKKKALSEAVTASEHSIKTP